VTNRRTDIWEPCDCANCRRVNEILQAGKKVGIALDNDQQPGMFRSWPKLVTALLGAIMFLSCIIFLWAIFSR
jgi:hypothetical protein